MPDADSLSNARHAYFGTTVTPMTCQQGLAHITGVLDSGKRRWLSGHHNLHSLYQLQHEGDVRHFYARCNDCYIDGTPVRCILRAFGVRTVAAQRFSLMDHFIELLQHAQRQQWSIFYLGSQESVVDSGRALIQKAFPELRIQLQHGYAPDAPELINTINAQRPDLLLVGMGMPLQERWLLQNIDRLDVGFAAQAGATLDYFTGAQARPPLWISRMGFAWLYRLIHNPVRLWRRYLLEPWALLRPTLYQWRRYRRCAGSCND